MTSRTRALLMIVVGIFAATASVVAQPKDPFAGTWTLNVAQSKYSPGPVPKEQTSTYESAGGGYRVTVKTTPASGAVQEWTYTTKLDGASSPINGNNPNADMTTVKRVDATTLEVVNTKGGKETTHQRNVVSADGKTRTVTTTGVDAQGQKVSNVAIFEKK